MRSGNVSAARTGDVAVIGSSTAGRTTAIVPSAAMPTASITFVRHHPPRTTCGRCRSKLRPDLPQFREKAEVERAAQIGDAGGTAGAGLATDDPLDRGDMAEAPLLEPV